MKVPDLKADAAAPGDVSVTISQPRPIGRGYRDYERYAVRLSDRTGADALFERDVLRCGPVVGVLALDPERQEVVLTHQFRLGAYLAAGESGTLEIVAGQIDPGEDAGAAARRECLEEIGVQVTKLVPMLELSPAPAWSDETMTLFLARVDARTAPPRAGAPHEQEQIVVVRSAIDQAIGLLDDKAVHSAPTVIALQWLKLNRDAIPTLLGPPAVDEQAMDAPNRGRS
jgi:ADP-ribose pyrophosphatase